MDIRNHFKQDLDLFSRFAVIWVLVTRLPLPKKCWPENIPPGNRCLSLVPLVGGIMGFMTGTFITVLKLIGIGNAVSAWAGFAFYVLSGWSIHLDGWCDVWDGIGSGKKGEELRAVMKDSRLGAYGAIGMVIAAGLWTSAISSLGSGSMIIVCMTASASGRFAMCAAALFGNYPWNSGMGKGWVDTFTMNDFIAATCCVLIFMPFAPVRGLFSVLLASLTGYSAACSMNKKLGGVNGDVLGTTAVTAEIFSLMVFSL